MESRGLVRRRARDDNVLAARQRARSSTTRHLDRLRSGQVGGGVASPNNSEMGSIGVIQDRNRQSRKKAAASSGSGLVP